MSETETQGLYNAFEDFAGARMPCSLVVSAKLMAWLLLRLLLRAGFPRAKDESRGSMR